MTEFESSHHAGHDPDLRRAPRARRARRCGSPRLHVAAGIVARRARAPRGYGRRRRGGHHHAEARRAQSAYVRGHGQGRRSGRACARPRGRPRRVRRRADALPAGEPREGDGPRREGHRPYGAHPRHLRPARHQQGGPAAGAARPERVPAAALARRAGPTWPPTAWAAAWDRASAKARASSRSTAAWCASASRPSSASSSIWPRCAPSSAKAVTKAACSRWRWPATRTPASRACSTG